MEKIFSYLLIILFLGCHKPDMSVMPTGNTNSSLAKLQSLDFKVENKVYSAVFNGDDSLFLNLPFGPCIQNGLIVNSIIAEGKGTTSVKNGNNLNFDKITGKYIATISVTSQDGSTSKNYFIKVNNDATLNSYTNEQFIGIGVFDSTMSQSDNIITISNLIDVPLTYTDLTGKMRTKSPINGILNLTKADLIPTTQVGPINMDFTFFIANACGDRGGYIYYKQSEIRHWKDLQGMRMGLRTDNGGHIFMGGSYKIMKDILFPQPGSDNLPIEGFAPIGYTAMPFIGTLNGNGKTIDNFLINRPQTDNVGLFGISSSPGNYSVAGLFVNNLNIHLSQTTGIVGRQNVGALVGSCLHGVTYNGGSQITNVNVEGGTVVASGLYTGGLIGVAQQVFIIGCSTHCKVNSPGICGGLIGQFYPSSTSFPSFVDSSNSRGDVAGSSTVGGLIGYVSSGASIKNSFSSGITTLTATSGNNSLSYVGGLVGFNSGTIKSCYATGKVLVMSPSSSFSRSAGGLIGQNSAGAISECYSANTITEINAGKNINMGGLIGTNDVSTNPSSSGVATSYSNSDLLANGTSINAGGLIGYQNISTSWFFNCYATGNITLSSSATSCNVGGLVGINKLGGPTIFSSQNAYYIGNIIIQGNNSNHYSPIWILLNNTTYINSYDVYTYFSSKSIFPNPSLMYNDIGLKGIDISTATQATFKNFFFGTANNGTWRWVQGQWPKLQWQP